MQAIVEFYHSVTVMLVHIIFIKSDVALQKGII